MRASVAILVLSATACAPIAEPHAAVEVTSAPVTSEPPVARPAPPPPRKPACVLHGSHDRIPSLPLRFRDEVFASASAALEGEVSLFAGETTGAARFDGAELALTGDVRIEDLRLAPRTAILRDGWIGVHGVRPVEVRDGAIVTQPKLPKLVQAASASAPGAIELDCADLGLGWGPNVPFADGRRAKLAAGKTSELRATRGGAVVGTLAVPRDADAETRTIHVLERKGRQTKIRLMGDETFIDAWIASSAIAKPAKSDADTMIGILLTDKDAVRRLRCNHEVPIYVGDKTARVGTYHAGATIYALGTKDDGPSVHVELFGQGEKRTPPLVERSQLEDCSTMR
ncbi:MAG: hypothetical protein KIT84_00935 [Labilithrix sp.]|nr:hypothetical protein [Labilithrix sp.]MCW5809549.1 hypothetical protein [Labilithrix sp.]